jgi:hypothetical protein
VLRLILDITLLITLHQLALIVICCENIMSIDDFQDSPLSLSEAAAICPGQPNVATLWRWCLKGCRGIRLNSYVIGGRRFTDRASIEEFRQLTTAAAEARLRNPLPAPAVAAPRRRKQHDAADDVCRAKKF